MITIRLYRVVLTLSRMYHKWYQSTNHVSPRSSKQHGRRESDDVSGLDQILQFHRSEPESILRLLLLLRDSSETISTEDLDLNCKRRPTIVSGSELNSFPVQEGGRGKETFHVLTN